MILTLHGRPVHAARQFLQNLLANGPAPGDVSAVRTLFRAGLICRAGRDFTRAGRPRYVWAVVNRDAAIEWLARHPEPKTPTDLFM